MRFQEVGERQGLSSGYRFRMDIQTKRVYKATSPDDGFRVLVDRLWPRGMTKEQAQADLWLKDVAPSTELRKWFGHDQAKWQAFKHRYFLELETKPDVVSRLHDKVEKGRVTLLFAAKDTECNHARALKEYLETQFDD